MIKIVHGDLLETDCKIIAHQVNCLGVMEHGVAKQIKEKYPASYRMYKEVCDAAAELGDIENLLGINFGCCVDDKIIVHMFAQEGMGTGEQTDYNALYKCLFDLENIAKRYKIPEIALPYKIGCGLAGGDWTKVLDMIEKIFADFSVVCTLYKFDKKDSYDKDVDLRTKFLLRTIKHKRLVNKYASRIGYDFPHHDSDKIDPLNTAYIHIMNPHRSAEEQKQLDEATLRHVTMNPHHPEYWTSSDLTGFTRENFCPNGIVEAVQMPEEALVEMVADWCAMSEEFGNTPFEWAEKVIGIRWEFTYKQIEFIRTVMDKMWNARTKVEVITWTRSKQE